MSFYSEIVLPNINKLTLKIKQGNLANTCQIFTEYQLCLDSGFFLINKSFYRLLKEKFNLKTDTENVVFTNKPHIFGYSQECLVFSF